MPCPQLPHQFTTSLHVPAFALSSPQPAQASPPHSGPGTVPHFCLQEPQALGKSCSQVPSTWPLGNHRSPSIQASSWFAHSPLGSHPALPPETLKTDPSPHASPSPCPLITRSHQTWGRHGPVPHPLTRLSGLSGPYLLLLTEPLP